MCQNIDHVIWYLTTNAKKIASYETLALTQSHAPKNCNLDVNQCKERASHNYAMLMSYMD